MNQQKMTELDKKLQEMALMNWQQFVQLIGEESIRSAKICLLRQSDHSYGEISMKLSIPKHEVRYACVSRCK